MRCLLLIVVTGIVAGCATDIEPRAWCESPALLVDRNFAGGNFYRCTAAEDMVYVEVRPEDPPPINRSPWYAFRVSPRAATSATIEIEFVDGYARYWPKLSNDGRTWRRAPEHAVSIAADGSAMSLELAVDEAPLYVSAQELLLSDWYESWLRELAVRDGIDVATVSRSVLGRPIQAARTAARDEVVLLFGRQHPPEVSGALAMRSFVDTVLGDSWLARQFRGRFRVVIVPLVNPDGVERGHWRHNVNGVDLNRDWGPFTQPETQGLRDLVAKLEADGARFRLMLDFHSTRESLFYTQMPDEFDEPLDFATEWLDTARQHLGDFPFKHDPRPPSEQANTKNYFFARYGIPAITYEIGDEVDRVDIEKSTPVFAEEMMRVLLARD